jgi:hypothetical protein
MASATAANRNSRDKCSRQDMPCAALCSATPTEDSSHGVPSVVEAPGAEAAFTTETERVDKDPKIPRHHTLQVPSV